MGYNHDMKFLCLTCNIEFKSLKHDKNRIPKYCNRQCYSKRIVSEETKKKQSAAKIGKKPWNKDVPMWKDRVHPRGTLGKSIGKGKLVTLETRKKLSLSHIGIKLPHQSKENHHGWKGGITPKNEAIRKSSEYKSWRKSVFTRDSFTCQICSKIGGELHADHILSFAAYPERRFDLNNGRTLCVECHKKTDTYGGKMHRNKNSMDKIYEKVQ